MNIYSDDIRIVQDVLSGNRNAFLSIIKRYQRLIYHIVNRMIPNRSDHEDLGQDIFLKVYSKLNTFKGEAKLSTWIAQIAYNTCLNYLDKKKFSLLDDQISAEESEEEFTLMNQVEDDNITPDFETERILSNKILQENISKLPAAYKIILTLYHLEEMKYKEISEITNLPEGTVKSYLFRARKMLREKITKNYQVEDLCH